MRVSHTNCSVSLLVELADDILIEKKGVLLKSFEKELGMRE
jgi:hypothetical protein